MISLLVALLVLLGQAEQNCTTATYGGYSQTAVLTGDTVTVSTDDRADVWLQDGSSTIYYTVVENSSTTISIPDAGTLVVETFAGKQPSTHTLTHCTAAVSQPASTSLDLSSVVPFLVILLLVLSAGGLLRAIVK